MPLPREPSMRRHPTGSLLCLALLCAALVLPGCGQAKPQPAEAIAVDPAGDGSKGDELDPRRQDDGTAPSSDDSASANGDGSGDGKDDGATSGTGDGVGAGDAAGAGNGASAGGLRVVAADGTLVGVLVSRGHPHQGASTAPAGTGGDVLRDGVLVYHPGAHLFFGVGMASGKVISPRLGIAEGDCLKPLVGGYYADGPEISGFDYAFVWKGNWWKVRGGEKLALVGCAGVGTGGETPTCVPHTGSCRGFPVDAIQPSLPASFVAPLHFDWQGVGG